MLTGIEGGPGSPLRQGDLIDLCGSWLGEEKERFYDALDALPLVDAQDIAADALEEWQRLSSAVGRSTTQVHDFAQREYERLQLDPDLVRARAPSRSPLRPGVSPCPLLGRTHHTYRALAMLADRWSCRRSAWRTSAASTTSSRQSCGLG